MLKLISGLDQTSCSNLIFHPGKRSEIWRYRTYMFVHSGKLHLTFNILAQLALGILLEMVHGKLHRFEKNDKQTNLFLVYSLWRLLFSYSGSSINGDTHDFTLFKIG